MNEPADWPLIAVDIGNTAMKIGRFEAFPVKNDLPRPVEVIHTSSQDAALTSLLEKLPDEAHLWRLASVQRQAQRRLADWVAQNRPNDDLRILSRNDLPLVLEVDEPDGVGVDRLVAAVAANRLRGKGQGAIVVDTGTAVTVDAVSTEGVFLGGAILPGVAMVARALKEEADLLPAVDFSADDDEPPALGKSTVGAIRSGLFWGMVGATRELIQRLSPQAGKEPLVLVTGGYAEKLVSHLAGEARYVPHLVLGGVALAASSATKTRTKES